MDAAGLYLKFRDNQQWLSDTFMEMTFAEYREFVDYCFKELDFACESKDGAEFFRVKGLILALARKELEIARFMDGLTDEQRNSAASAAEAYFQLARSFYLEDQHPAVDAAWKASREHGETYGYPSPIAEILAPHHVFRTD